MFFFDKMCLRYFDYILWIVEVCCGDFFIMSNVKWPVGVWIKKDSRIENC